MSEYMFGISHTKPTRVQAKKIERIARQHGCWWQELREPGRGYQSWFSGPNRGCPFDGAMAEEVYDHLDRAGLYEPLFGAAREVAS